ncbi:MAG TPA: SMC-Scp complex subunit ScpB [Phycisphaerales bacterium]|nr:SMC-Scp complex subunit ScpB [Phycisphaerales bacterium]
MNLPNIPPEHAIEAMLFASPTPIPAEELAEAGGWSKREVEDYVERLRRQLKDRSLEVRKVAGAYSLLTKSEVAPFVERILQVQNKQRLTKVQLEILSIVAYKQPITRPQLEEARGINGDRTLAQLIDLELVCQVGRAELPGRPFLFGTTDLFLEHFGMSSLDDLPELAWDESDGDMTEFSLEESMEEETPIRSREMQQLAEDISGPSSNLQKLLAKIRKKEDKEESRSSAASQ